MPCKVLLSALFIDLLYTYAAALFFFSPKVDYLDSSEPRVANLGSFL